MSSSNPPAKRKRPNDTDSELGITKSKYWFDDGNVVIQAENTLFRVHRSMLSRHSSVFKDMFDIPQPQQQTEHANAEFEGYPIIPISDKARDFEHVMSIFYDNIRDHDMRDPMHFNDLAAILRLGKKYDIEYLLNEGHRRLRADFPDNLPDWDALSTLPPDQIMDDDFYHERAMALGHELSVNTILPTACLLYIQTSEAKEILQIMEDGSTTDDTLLLPPQLLRACLEARDTLLCRVQITFLEWIHSDLSSPIPGNDCPSPVKCRSYRAQVITSLPALRLFKNIAAMDLYVLPSEIDDQICKKCRASLKGALHDFRTDVWKDLPSLFKIGDSWEVLKDF